MVSVQQTIDTRSATTSKRLFMYEPTKKRIEENERATVQGRIKCVTHWIDFSFFPPWLCVIWCFVMDFFSIIIKLIIP